MLSGLLAFSALQLCNLNVNSIEHRGRLSSSDWSELDETQRHNLLRRQRPVRFEKHSRSDTLYELLWPSYSGAPANQMLHVLMMGRQLVREDRAFKWEVLAMHGFKSLLQVSQHNMPVLLFSTAQMASRHTTANMPCWVRLRSAGDDQNHGPSQNPA